MNKKVVWTRLAAESFREMLRETKREWGESTKNKFRDLVAQTTQRIENNVYTFPVFDVETRRHKAVVHKNCILIYRIINSEQAEIEILFDPRKDPEKLAYLLLD